MKSKKVELGQYAIETKGFDGDEDEFLEITAPLIGRIVYEFNSLEGTLTSLVCQLINNRADDLGLIITHKMSYSGKVDLFKRLIKWLQGIFDKDVAIFQKLYTDLKECGKLRNMVVHAEWDATDSDGFTLVKLRVEKNGLYHEYVQFDEASLIKIEELIIETGELFETLDEQLQSLD